MNKKISFSIAIIIIIICAVLAGGLVIWQYFGMPKGEEVSEEIAPKDETADLSSKALATEDWKTYRNKEYGFEIKYPQGWEYLLFEDKNIISLPRNVRSDISWHKHWKGCFSLFHLFQSILSGFFV